MTNLPEISTRLAAGLLLQKGELSLSDIRALPFVEDEETVSVIALVLSRKFDVETYQRKAGVKGHHIWEEVIRLRQPYFAGSRGRRSLERSGDKAP